MLSCKCRKYLKTAGSIVKRNKLLVCCLRSSVWELRETDLRVWYKRLFYNSIMESQKGACYIIAKWKWMHSDIWALEKLTNLCFIWYIMQSSNIIPTRTTGGVWSIGNCRWRRRCSAFAFAFLIHFSFSYFYISGLWFQVNGLLWMIHARKNWGKWKLGEFLAPGKENKFRKKVRISRSRKQSNFFFLEIKIKFCFLF